jgi:hypothetical protein
LAFGATCDLCGADLLGLDVRYILNLELAQAYDPMEVTAKDLKRNLRGELEELIKSLEKLPAGEARRLEEEVYSSFRFDVCPQCAEELRTDAKKLLRVSYARLGPLPSDPGEKHPAT